MNRKKKSRRPCSICFNRSGRTRRQSTSSLARPGARQGFDVSKIVRILEERLSHHSRARDQTCLAYLAARERPLAEACSRVASHTAASAGYGMNGYPNAGQKMREPNNTGHDRRNCWAVERAKAEVVRSRRDGVMARHSPR